MIIELFVKPDQVDDDAFIQRELQAKLSDEMVDYRLVRKWIDARRRPPRFGLRYEVNIGASQSRPVDFGYADVRGKPVVHIIGAGPAGYFAALEALRLGLRPMVFEQGKDVRRRRRDLRAIQQDGVVNPVSNYGFGEGGAGTYSDGKLYTRANKRGNVRDVIDQLIAHGAPADIAIDAHPHIGSNKLPNIITAMRETIESCGGEVRFDAKVVDIQATPDGVEAIQFEDGGVEPVDHLILATGHSARDIYFLFHDKGWQIEAKPFAIGCRIEHPQPVIDKMQYGQYHRASSLPAASYSLACQVDGHGVYSFCMCPGGLIVPASTAPGEIVVNGMSLSRRDSPFANSGFVTEVDPSRIGGEHHGQPLVGVHYQADLERKMYALGDGSQCAPGQRVVDFIDKRQTIGAMETSYIPGVFPARLDRELPRFIVDRLSKGLKQLNRRMKGYIHPEAILVGVESRTSSPVRIPRDSVHLCHPDIPGLYPCGEGAGYAGGIMSAAMDGQRVMRAVAATMREVQGS